MEFLFLIIIAVIYPLPVLLFTLIPISALLFSILKSITNITPCRDSSKDEDVLDLSQNTLQNEFFYDPLATPTKCIKIATTIFLSIPSLFCFTYILSDLEIFFFYMLSALTTFAISMIFLFFYKRLFEAKNYAEALFVLASPFIPSFLSFSLGILLSPHNKIKPYLWIAIIIYATAIIIMSIILLFLRKRFKKECDSPEQQSE